MIFCGSKYHCAIRKCIANVFPISLERNAVIMSTPTHWVDLNTFGDLGKAPYFKPGNNDG